MKRKASDCHPSPSSASRSKQSCFSVPQWVLDGEARVMDMAVSPPVKRAFIATSDTPDHISSEPARPGPIDVEMGSPMQASPRQPQSRRSTSFKFGRSISYEGRPDHPGDLSMVPQTQFDAVQVENAMLKDALAALTKELAESKSRIKELEVQCSRSQQISRGCLATGFRSPMPHQQQTVYFAPHQFVPVPQYGQ